MSLGFPFLLGIPTYLILYLFLMAIYHATMYATMKETKKSIQSKIWDNITFGNYWGVILTILTFLLLFKLFQFGVSSTLIILAIFFDIIAHYLALLTTYNLALPILKSLKIFRQNYFPAFLAFPSFIFLISNNLKNLILPGGRFNVIIIYAIFSLIIVFYLTSLMKIVSGRYSDLGFVYKPFLIGSLGGLSALISVFIISLIIFKLKNPNLLNELYYYVFFYSALLMITLIQFLRFVVDYPSAIQPRWKAYMPVDPLRIAVSVTLIFLTVSLYLTTRDLNIIYSIPLWSFTIVGLVLIPLAALFIYTRAFAGETTLGYWTYIKTEMAAHLLISLYVLSTAVILWEILRTTERLLFGLFLGFTYFFYVTAALDMKKLTQDLKVKVHSHPLTIIRYMVTIFATFFIIFFMVLLTRGTATSLDVFFQQYAYFPLALIGIFFVFYFTSLKRTHKGFEQLMKKGTITDISYILSLGVFIALFLLYLRIRGPASLLSQFPLFGTVFIGYFAILIAEVHSTTTLRIKEYKEKKDITDLLNSVAGHFFRTDILEEMWNDVIETYKGLDPELERARFYPPDRTFDMSMVNDKARVTASLAMLRKMESATKDKEAPVVPFDINLKKDSERLLGEKILLLPEEFSKDFKRETYYPKLLESTFNRINEAIKPFVSSEDYAKILKKLVKVDLFFNNLSFDASGVKIKKGLELNRKDFLIYLKLYIQGLENTFPFNRLLLRETVKSEVQKRLSLYGFTQADVLNVVPSGVKELDEVLYGGLIKGTSTLFLSEERRAKNDVLFMFITEGLKEKEHGIYSTSRISSKDLLEAFKRAVKGTDKLTLIDLYLATHTDNVVKIPVTRDGSQIISTSLIQVRQSLVAAIKKYPKEAHKRVVLDLYSDLARYQKLEEIFDLLIRQVEGFKRWNCTSIITLAPNLSNGDLERHFDNVLLLTDVSTIKIKKLFGGKPKKDTFIIWGTYAPIEEPDYPLFFEA
jgi:KaiC/GvpD/RAD55 family RecA-like ATPase